ncbi:hypothetical protein [Gryllotalpicola ginsengisoli]|uniref:hypothetical protein n=1 Tax=Gryllotalpicola ginsengisoli TaxID=444608 RepID=UPI0003B51C34|nr:hypothetical protein [Gryllotalpicola ginsengisoli]
MIASSLARQLREAGLKWHPVSGDAFRIESPEFTGEETFTVSDMTIEPHEFDTGTILGFNGTTEWALDSVAIEKALWIPREDQLRTMLGGTFRTLTRLADGTWRVEVERGGERSFFDGDDAETAYGCALLELIDVSALG